MEINPLNRLGVNLTIGPAQTPSATTPGDSQIVAAVRGLNQSEFLSQNHTLTYKRDPKTGHMVIQIVERDSGDVVDQIPPEAVLRLSDEIKRILAEKDTPE